MRTVLVSGGNRGIGLATVQALAAHSEDKILLACRNLEQGQAEAQSIGENVQAVHLDLSDSEQLEAQINWLQQNFPRVDVLINNAAVLYNEGFLDISMQRFAEAWQINTMGPFQLLKAFVPGMLKQGYGRIVNLSSGWGSFEDGLSGPFSYSFTKAALNALTLTVAKELKGNVKINAVCPGWVRTRMGGMMASRSPEQGAETVVYLASLPEDGPSGGFFRDKKLISW